MTAIELAGNKYGGCGMKTKHEARHQLKQLGWTDEELDAIGLTLLHEGDNSKLPEQTLDSPYHY
jgi:hypothetical protein